MMVSNWLVDTVAHWPTAKLVSAPQRINEIASLLARGLIRLRQSNLDRSPSEMSKIKELSIGFLVDQRLHTDPVNKSTEESE